MKTLSGYWYLAYIDKIDPRSSKQEVHCVFIKLKDDYNLTNSPFDKKQYYDYPNIYHSKKIIRYNDQIPSSIIGSIYHNGKILGLQNTNDHFKFKVCNHSKIVSQTSEIFRGIKFNKTNTSSLDMNSYFNVFSKNDLKLEKISNKTVNENLENIEAYLIPCHEIARLLYLRTADSIKRFFDQSIEYDSDIEHSGYQTDNPDVYEIIGSENLTNELLYVIASIKEIEGRKEHYEVSRSKTAKSLINPKENGAIITFLPKDIKSFTVRGRIVNYRGHLLFWGFELLSLDIDYPYIDCIPGGPGGFEKEGDSNSSDQNQNTKNVRTSPSFIDDDEVNSTDDHFQNSDNSKSVIKRGDVGFPKKSKRKEKPKKYKTNVIPEKSHSNDFTYSSQTTNDKNAPNKAVQELQDDNSISKDETLQLFDSIIEDLTLDKFGCLFMPHIYQNFHPKEYIDRPYLSTFCSFPKLVPLSENNFPGFYKIKKNKWKGNRGVHVVRVSYGGNHLYMFEIERRNSLTFSLLIVHMADYSEIIQSILLEILEIGAEYDGQWSNAKFRIESLGLVTERVNHNQFSFHRSVRKHCIKLTKL